MVALMTSPIEAQSLTSVTHLLANPPQYPRNPTHQIQKPLVLYIVRVPGKNDVFLTPLKPPTKSSISLEAIQSSLYYLHVNTPEDDAIRRSIDSQRLDHSENIPFPVARKPLPPLPHAFGAGSTQPYPSSDTFPHHDSSATVLEDRSNGQYSNIKEPENARANTIRRKPISRPSSHFLPSQRNSLVLSDESKGSEAFNLSASYLSRGQEARLYDSSGQSIPGRPSSYIRSHSDIGSLDSPGSIGQSSTGPTMSPVAKVLKGPTPTITLIRRDPVSGAQWNIGNISQSETSTIGSNLKPVAIELTTPGYTKFLNQLEIPRSENSGSTAESIKSAIAMHQQSLSPIMYEDFALRNFTRRVEFRSQQEAVRQFRLQSRASSHDSIPNYPIQNKPPRSIYSFTSPWQGLCTFSNGIDGKSLRCRHTLPATDHQEEGISTNVAELRFNLAWSLLSPRDANKQQVSIDVQTEGDTLPISQLLKQPKSGKETWRRSMQHIKTLSRDLKDLPLRDRDRRDQFQIEAAYAANARHGGTGSNSLYRPPMDNVNNSHHREEHNPYRLSLKLGQEKAGGGFQGNSAKLGKLIIEDEGLKMGDLVVAACMSVWWQHYAGSVGL